MKAEENIVEREYDRIVKSCEDTVRISLNEKYNILSKLHDTIDVIGLDSHGIIENLLKAKLFNNSNYIKNIKDFFPDFEETLRENLANTIMVLYGKNWQEHLDTLKKNQGIKKSEKAATLVIGDLAKIYKQIVLDGNLIKITAENKKKFIMVMDNLAVHRNNLAHNAATLRGWDKLFSFCQDFIPIHHKFISFFNNPKRI